ncbi:metalloreductase [Coprinopsis sp. MPI-PUGE-AT-0042]|nr:metalloreductase [Coprinopsis sp. MPI-PUGE-AT-0042]
MANSKLWSALCTFAFLAHLIVPATADGVGLLGGGKWLYKPPCAHACRSAIANNELACDPKDGTSQPDAHAHTKRHGHAANTLECYLKDAVFMRTLALCIDQRCVKDDKVPMSVVEDYWEGHVGTGAVGDWSLAPGLRYQDALTAARHDTEEMGEGNVPYVTHEEPLSVTSLVSDEDYLPAYNGNKWFDITERDHGINSIAVAVSTVAIPILASLLRFLPGRPLWYSRLVNVLDVPLMGHRHRVPVPGNAGIMPTRAQTLYLVYLLTTQILLSIFPLAFLYPNNISDTRRLQIIQIIGRRSGALGMADFVALFLFSSRNNVMLWVTDWSHSTFLLFHRWIAYCAIFQICFHSMFFVIIRGAAAHAEESKLPYWIWGIVGTLSFVVMWPLASLPMRRKAYEVFLASHQIFAALALIATFMHIFDLFQYQWGYEIWVYIGGGLWFFDRLLRILRIASNGTRTAIVTAVNPEADYIRVDIDGIVASGHVYAYFPTLSWRIWENHPLSVVSSFASGPENASIEEKSSSDVDLKEPAHTHSLAENREIRPRATLLIRPINGTTNALAARLRASGGHLSLPVVVESSYHSNPSLRNLDHCSTLLCIAGGVGITGVLPVVRSFKGARARLVWSMRNDAPLQGLRPELDSLRRSTVELETRVGGERFNMMDVVRDELEREGVRGDLGIVVCGPAGMADDVRAAVGQLGPKSKRGVVFIDEAFSW